MFDFSKLDLDFCKLALDAATDVELFLIVLLDPDSCVELCFLSFELDILKRESQTISVV